MDGFKIELEKINLANIMEGVSRISSPNILKEITSQENKGRRNEVTRRRPAKNFFKKFQNPHLQILKVALTKLSF